jgi:hypothetical protein
MERYSAWLKLLRNGVVVLCNEMLIRLTPLMNPSHDIAHGSTRISKNDARVS